MKVSTTKWLVCPRLCTGYLFLGGQHDFDNLLDEGKRAKYVAHIWFTEVKFTATLQTYYNIRHFKLIMLMFTMDWVKIRIAKTCVNKYIKQINIFFLNCTKEEQL